MIRVAVWPCAIKFSCVHSETECFAAFLWNCRLFTWKWITILEEMKFLSFYCWSFRICGVVRRSCSEWCFNENIPAAKTSTGISWSRWSKSPWSQQASRAEQNTEFLWRWWKINFAKFKLFNLRWKFRKQLSLTFPPTLFVHRQVNDVRSGTAVNFKP